jgi:hypothetical protein
LVDKPTTGRKPIPVEDRKVQVSFYIAQKYIDKLGGMEKTKDFCESLLEEWYDKESISRG